MSLKTTDNNQNDINSNNKSSLKRELGLWAVICLGISATIGSGIFSTMSEVAAIAGSGIFLLLAFVIGGLLQIPSSLIFAELSSAYPEDGGFYVYLREAGSKCMAFLAGWTVFWASDPPSVSIMALALVNYLAVLLPFDTLVLRIIVCCLILFFTLLNVRSVKGGGIVMSIITFIKVVPFIAIIGIGVFFLQQNILIPSETNQFMPNGFFGEMGIVTLFAATATTTLSYDGLFAASYMSGEIKNPKKNLPRGLIITVLVIVALYSALMFVSCGLVDIQEIAESSAPMALVASKLPFVGEYAGTVVAVIAVIVITGTISSAIMYQPRAQYAMAKDGYFFKFFALEHKKYNTPYGALLADAAVIIVFTFVGDLSAILGYFTFICLIKNFVSIGTIYILRRKDNYNPSYKMPLGNILPAVALVVNLCLIFSTFVASPVGCGISASILIGTGLIAYFIWDKRKKKDK